ncbi:MAG: hypothetical protein P8J68_00765 [Arenicellaceae bacterium]|nr:hypothetical protein [Arenicellaceae bacterium]
MRSKTATFILSCRFVSVTILLGWHANLHAQPNLEGVWGIDPTLFRQYSELQYTPEGQRRAEAFNPLTDDPSYGCIPSGLGRAWDEPDTSAKIEQFEDYVVISYEMFDLVRNIKLNQNGHPLQADPSTHNLDGVAIHTMGHSIAWYEDDALMIETLAYAPGYVTTLRRVPPQSEAMRSIERITVDDDDRLLVEISYSDPINYTEPLIATNRYYRSDFEFIVYGCVSSNPSEEGG